MDDCQRQFQALLELDARHDALLEELGELDRRVAKVLAECLAARDAPLFGSRTADRPQSAAVASDLSPASLSPPVQMS